jgi:signal peptidase II
MRKYLKTYSILALVLFSACLVDQYTKMAVLQFLRSQNIETFEITGFLNFITVWNKGISFGLFANHHLPPGVFVGIALTVVILVIWLMKDVNPIIQGMIIGGAFGNIIDRAMFGGVFDFIDIHIDHWHYPAFNLADSFIVCSIILIIFNQIKKDKK